MDRVNDQVLVKDVLLTLDKFVVLKPIDLFRVAIEHMSKKRLGIACVVDDKGHLMGVFTDGDIRRLLLHEHKPLGAFFVEDVGDHVTPNPKTVSPNMSLVEAVAFMETADVYDLPVVDDEGKLVGLLHVHTALKYLLSR